MTGSALTMLLGCVLPEKSLSEGLGEVPADADVGDPDAPPALDDPEAPVSVSAPLVPELTVPVVAPVLSPDATGTAELIAGVSPLPLGASEPVVAEPLEGSDAALVDVGLPGTGGVSTLS